MMSLGLACLLASLTSVRATTPDNVYLEFSKLFTSHASKHFPSEKDYIESHKQFETRVFDANNKLADRAHSFVVQLDDSCASECHSALLHKFSSSRYHIYSKNHGTIYGSLSEIKEFQAGHPNIIKHMSPVHPDMKIDAKLREVSSLSNGCYPTPLKTKTLTSPSTDIKIKAPVHRIRVSMIPLQEAELTEFLAFTEDLKKQHKNQFSFELEKKRKYTRGMVGILVTSRCDKVTSFATALAQRREVHWMEVDRPVHVHNRWSRGICDTGDASYTPLTNEGLLGEGEIVGVSDTGLDLTSCYFYDDRFNATFPYKYQYDELTLNDHRKVIQYVAYRDDRDDAEAHGTHVSGSVAGLSYQNYGDFAKYNGMAYNAKIAFFDIGYANGDGEVAPPSDLYDELFYVMYQAGARVFSNSWGNGNNQYDSLARYVDEFMWTYPDSCIMFSAGNTGYLGAHSAGSPSINKNGICVGAALNNYDSWRANTLDTGASDKHDIMSVAYFSSQGPTAEGRMKPDILAPGWYVQSAEGYANSSDYHCTVKGLSGTSMATPTAAGFAAKVRQYYRNGYYPSGRATRANEFIPSGALIKATLIHSGQPMEYIMRNTSVAVDVGSYPNNIQGFGRIEMDKVLNFGTSSTNPISLFVVGAVNSSYGSLYAEITSQSLSKSYTFHTSSSSSQSALRITLCYTDYYTGAGSSSQMINLLTFSVTDGHGHTYTPSYTSDQVQSTAQMVDIDASSVVAGSTYTVTVSASSVSQSQPFALVVSGAITYLNLTAEKVYTAPSHSATYISHGATIDIILLAIAVVILCGMVYFFSRLTKRSRNLEYDPYATSSTQQQTGIMGTVQRMRMQAIEKQRQMNASHPSAPAKKQPAKKKHAGGGSKSKPHTSRHAAPQQDYVYNPRDFE